MRQTAVLIWTLALFLMSLPSCLSAAVTDGMTLQGSGKIRYLMFDVYRAKLYTEPVPPGNASVLTGLSRCLILSYDVDIKAQDMIKAAEKVLARQYNADYLNRFREQIDQLHRSYRPVTTGDSYSLCYNAEDETTTLSLNDSSLVTISSRDFAEIYFGIWLSPDQPIDEKLQQQLTEPLRHQGES